MTRICEYCGKEYEPQKEYQQYCSGKCRSAAFRAKKREERKEAIRAYKARQAEKLPTQPKRDYHTLSETDPRSRLVKMRARGLLTPEYWELYAAVDQEFYGGRTVVNNVPTSAAFFPEAVLITIEETGVIHSWIQGTRNNATQEEE